MKRIALALAMGSWPVPAQAQTFADPLESTIAPQFPLVGGQFQLPPSPTTTQWQWLQGELQAGQITTAAEVNAHFDPAWLATTPVQQTIAFIDAVRTSYPNARITDVISHTPNRMVALIDSPGSPPPSGFLSFGTRYCGAGLIVQFGVSSFGGSVMYPVDPGALRPSTSARPLRRCAARPADRKPSRPSIARWAPGLRNPTCAPSGTGPGTRAAAWRAPRDSMC